MIQHLHIGKVMIFLFSKESSQADCKTFSKIFTEPEEKTEKIKKKREKRSIR